MSEHYYVNAKDIEKPRGNDGHWRPNYWWKYSYYVQILGAYVIVLIQCRLNGKEQTIMKANPSDSYGDESEFGRFKSYS